MKTKKKDKKRSKDTDDDADPSVATVAVTRGHLRRMDEDTSRGWATTASCDTNRIRGVRFNLVPNVSLIKVFKHMKKIDKRRIKRQDFVSFPTKDTMRRDQLDAKQRARYLSKEVGTFVRSTKESAAASATEALSRHWILDSGSCWDIISTKDMSRGEKKTRSRLQIAESLSTVNGEITCKDVADIAVKKIDLEVHPLVVKSSPAILSLGQRCMKDGFAFHWEPYKPPTLVHPDGRVVELDVLQGVPLLYDDGVAASTPSLSAAPLSSPDCEHTSAAGVAQDAKLPTVPLTQECSVVETHADSDFGDENLRAKKAATNDKAGRSKPPDATHYLTHFPVHPRCRICQNAKIQRKQCRRKTGTSDPTALPLPAKFGDLVTGDHIILADDESASRHGDYVALVLQDSFTKWIECHPAETKSAEECKKAFTHFTGNGEIERFYSDGSKELAKMTADLGISHDTSTPYRPETNGVAERAVRRVLEGSRAVLLQSNLPHDWWSEAATCFCFLRNVSDAVDGKLTPYELRYGEKFKGHKIPFGAFVEYRPPGKKKDEKKMKFEARTRTGVFVGYSHRSGGQWTGDYCVLDLDVYKQSMDLASVQVVRVKEVLPPTPPYRFLTQEDVEASGKPAPAVDDGNDQALISEDSPIEYPQDVYELRGSLLVRRHNTPRDTLFSPTESLGDLPVDLSELDVSRSTYWEDEQGQLGDAHEDFWFPDEKPVSVKTKSKGETRFTVKLKPDSIPAGYYEADGRFTRKQKTNRPPHVWPEIWKIMSARQRKEAVAAWEAQKKERQRAEDRLSADLATRSSTSAASPSCGASGQHMQDFSEELPFDETYAKLLMFI